MKGSKYRFERFEFEIEGPAWVDAQGEAESLNWKVERPGTQDRVVDRQKRQSLKI